MRFTIWTLGSVGWYTAERQAQLAAYGWQFGPTNAHGLAPLTGPVTSESDYGMQTAAVRVEVPTLDALCALLTCLGSVTISMDPCDPMEMPVFMMAPAERQE